ncbi:hypothetical protein BJV82DRAFT_398028 [Fennellomyces sp. T-0311]|nr:hypothetical protein BJV82DRAFT_398028 [Fennellomyces sp. T-0311]
MPYGRVDSLGEDYADLESILDHDGRFTPASAGRNPYRISFQSVDDDELQRLMRALVTPVPRHSPDDNWRRQRHDDTTSQTSDSSVRRSESVMLFKKINDGDEDLSFDLVASDLKDFMDPVMLEGIMSRPSSRAPRSITPGTADKRSGKRPDAKKLDTKKSDVAKPELRKLDVKRPELAKSDVKSSKRASLAIESDERMNEMLSKSAQKTRELLEAMERSLKTEQTYAARRSRLAIDEDKRSKSKARIAAEEQVRQKRQSLDLDAMMALRRDGDAIIERRLSLLKERANKLLLHADDVDAPSSEPRRRRWSFSPIEEDAPVQPALQSVRARTFSMREQSPRLSLHESSSREPLPKRNDRVSDESTTSSSAHTDTDTIEEDARKVLYMRRSDMRKSRNAPEIRPESKYRQSRRLTVASGDNVRAEINRRLSPTNTAAPRQASPSSAVPPNQAKRLDDADPPRSPTADKSVAETAKDLLDSIRQRRQSTAFESFETNRSQQEAALSRLRSRRKTVVANGLDYHDDDVRVRTRHNEPENSDGQEDSIRSRVARRLSMAAEIQSSTRMDGRESRKVLYRLPPHERHHYALHE